MNNNKKYDLIVVGAGAAGMFAAYIAAQNNKVLIIEKNDRVGKKILVTGNGKCNLSNIQIDKNKISKAGSIIENAGAYKNYSNNSKDKIVMDFYHGANYDFISSIIKRFDYQDAMNTFNSLGLATYIDERGLIYPKSEQAASVLDCLRFSLENKNIDLLTCQEVESIEKTDSVFEVSCKNKKYYSDNIIISTGGRAAPKTGSDGAGYKFAKKFGHKILPVVPALTGLVCKGNFKAISGVRINASLNLYIDDALCAKEYGNLQITDYGLSGIPIFCLSAFAARALNDGKKVKILVDFIGNDFKDKAFSTLSNTAKAFPDRSASKLMSGIINKKLGDYLLKAQNIDINKPLNETLINKVLSKASAFEFDVEKTNSFENAQVSSGGISTKDVNPNTMESKKVKGLFFAGEVLDVDGICGGYNLHFAWASGYIAGKAVGHKYDKN